MKKDLEKENLVFFPGYPEMEFHMSGIKSILSRKYNIFYNPNLEEIAELEGFVLMAYSAGVIKASRVFWEFPGKVKRIILIDPSGNGKGRSLSKHIRKFLLEWKAVDDNFSKLKLSILDEFIEKARRPLKFIREIREIKDFNLRRALQRARLLGIEFLVIKSLGDTLYDQKEIIPEAEPFTNYIVKPGHFGFIQIPKLYLKYL